MITLHIKGGQGLDEIDVNPNDIQISYEVGRDTRVQVAGTTYKVSETREEIRTLVRDWWRSIRS